MASTDIPTQTCSKHLWVNYFFTDFHSKQKSVKKAAPHLFEALKNHFQSKKIKNFKVAVGSTLIPACRFYEKMGGHLTADITVHQGEISRVYVWDI